MSAHGHRLIGALLGALCVLGGAQLALAQIPLMVDEPATGNFSEDDWGLQDLTLDRDGDASWSDGYIFAGEAAQSVRITASSEVPVYLVLLDPSGDTLADGGGSGTFASLNEELPEDGVYTVIVNSPQSLPGNYTLTLSQAGSDAVAVADVEGEPPAETPPMEAETPPMEAETPPVEAETPPVEAETPPMEAETPPMEAETPTETAEGELFANAEAMDSPEAEALDDEPDVMADASAGEEATPWSLEAAVAVETNPSEVGLAAVPEEGEGSEEPVDGGPAPAGEASEPLEEPPVAVGEEPLEEPPPAEAEAPPGEEPVGETAVEEPGPDEVAPTEDTGQPDPEEAEVPTPAAGHARSLAVGRTHRDAFAIGDPALEALIPEEVGNTNWSDAYAIDAPGGSTLVVEVRGEVAVYLALLNGAGRMLAVEGVDGLRLNTSVSWDVPRDQVVYAVASTVDGIPGTYRITVRLGGR